MNRSIARAYGFAAYAAALASLVWLVAFVENGFLASTVDRGPTVGVAQAVVIDLALLMLFGWAGPLLLVVSLLGFGLMLLTTFVIDHADLFGLKQVSRYVQGVPYDPPELFDSSLYRFVRHPVEPTV